MTAGRRFVWFSVAAVWMAWLAATGEAAGTNGSWTYNGNGNWGDTNRWAGGTNADGVGATAWFTNNLTTARTITVDTNSRTLGLLNVGHPTTGYTFTFAGNGGARLVFNNGGANAQLNETSTSKGDTFNSTLPLALVDSLDISNASTNLLTVAGPISNLAAGVRTISNVGSGSGGVTLSGTIGTNLGVVQSSATSLLSLSGVNTFTGGVFIKAGTVKASVSVNSLGANANPVTLGDTTGAANATLYMSLTSGNFPQPIAVSSNNTGIACISNAVNGTVLSGPVTLWNHDLSVLAASPVILSGGVTGTGTLQLCPSGANSIKCYGPAKINNTGAIVITGPGVGGASAVLITNGVGANVTAISINLSNAPVTLSGTPLEVNSSGTTLANNNVGGGSAVLTVSCGMGGTGDLVLSNNSGIADGITLSGGITNAGKVVNSGAGSGNALISGYVSNVTAIVEKSSASALTVSGDLTVNGAGTTLANQNAGGTALLTLSGNVSGSGSLTLSNNSAIANGITLSGALINHKGAITNSGTGAGDVLISAVIGTNVTRVVQNSATSRLVLAAANTCTGTTIIANGRLRLDGSLSSGAVSVSSGGILQGNGTAGSVTNALGGTLSPGVEDTSVGTLTAGNLTWNGGGIFRCQVTNIANNEAGAGVDYDQIVVSGSLAAVPGGSNLVLRMDSLGQTLAFQTNRNYSLKVMSCGTAATLTPADVSLDTNAFLAGGTWTVTNLNKSIYVVCLGATSTNKNYWTGTGTWSTAANWSKGHAPLPGEDVEFDFRSTSNCTANLVSNNLGSITLAAGYTGTVTFAANAVEGGMNLTLAGDLAVYGGNVVLSGLTNAVNGGSVAEPFGIGYAIQASNILIAAGTSIHADGKGFAAYKGPGRPPNNGPGASYGGQGGTYSPSYSNIPGPCYGPASAPTALGSGAGSSGGGAIKVTVSDRITVNGRLSANVGAGLANSGGGAGGSIWIASGTLDGTGTIAANGGIAGNSHGDGGGGRVDISGVTNNFAGLIQANGGDYGGDGGPTRGLTGSILLPLSAGTGLTMANFVPSVDIAFGNSLTFTSPVLVTNGVKLSLDANPNQNTFTFTSLTIATNSSVTCLANVLAINAAAGGTSNNPYGQGVIIVASNVTINAGGVLTATGKGHIQGPGSPSRYGGLSSAGVGSTYGPISSVTALGSGALNGTVASAGGGAIELLATGVLWVDGTLSADGETAVGTTSGGSGGSVWIDCATLQGAGSISANGGDGDTGVYASGSGGRIHLAVTSRAVPNPIDNGKVTAYGAASPRKAAAGTVLITDRGAGDQYGTLIVENNAGASNTVTTLLPTNTDCFAGTPPAVTVDRVYVRGNGVLEVPGGKTLNVVSAFSNGAAFLADSNSTVAFVGTNDAAVFGTITNANLSVSNAASKTVRFEAGKTNVVTGRLSLYNATVLSSSTGQWWYLYVDPATGTQDVRYVTAQDSNATNGQTIAVTGAPSTDAGNNVNWSFPAGGQPEINNGGGAVNVRTNSADLLGNLVFDGGSPCTVYLFYGFDDKGSNKTWAFSTNYTTSQGVLSNRVDGLTPDRAFFYTYYASNSGYEAWASPSVPFLSSEVWIDTSANASEAYLVPGTFTVHRASAATNNAITVAYAKTGGTAQPGNNYDALSGTVTLPLGAATAPIVVTPRADFTNLSDATLQVTLTAAAAPIGVPSNATMTIYNDPTPTRTWTDASGDGKWSTAANWSPGGVPQAGERAMFSGDSQSNCLADVVSNNLGSLVMNAGYTGTVTVLTKYPGQGIFTNMTLAGDCVINGGVLTHSTNTGGAAQSDRLAITVGGNLTVGAGGRIDVDAKGFAPGQGPGTGGSGSTNAGAGHGGLGSIGTAMRGASATYGAAYAPTTLGSGGYVRGGGAVVLNVAGAASIDGTITAAGGGSVYAAGAGGSILLTAASLSGSGTLTAGGGASSGSTAGAGGGGRVGVILTNGTSFGGVAFRAYGADGGIVASGAGTVYLQKAGQSEGQGTLIVDNNNLDVLGACTLMPDASAWNGDHNLNGLEAIVIRNQGVLGINTNTALDFGAARIQGYGASVVANWGTTNMAPAASAIALRGTNRVAFPNPFVISNYSLCLDVPFSVSGNWTVAANGSLSHSGNYDPVPGAEEFRLKLDLTGNLSVDAGGAIEANSKGYFTLKGPSAAGMGQGRQGASHGGRGGSGLTIPISGDCYGSVRAPRTLGSGGGTYAGPPRPGGGSIELSIQGTTIVEGAISTRSDVPVSARSAGAAGGSIYLQTAYLQGSGVIDARGDPSGSDNSGTGGGGRIAVKLTQSESFGNVTLSASGAAGSYRASGPGPIYLERASESNGRGRVLIDNAGIAITVTNSMQLPAPTYAVANELKKAVLVITNYAQVALTTNLVTGDLFLYANSALHLRGYTQIVAHAYHADWGSTNRVVYEGGDLIWRAQEGTIFTVH